MTSSTRSDRLRAPTISATLPPSRRRAASKTRTPLLREAMLLLTGTSRKAHGRRATTNELCFFRSHGHALVHFDPKLEAKLRWKIDCYVVPTVSLLYLFC